MVQFYSEYNNSMYRYEKACMEAKASNSDRYEIRIQRLVDGGLIAIEEFEALMEQRYQEASCLVEYDGVSIGRWIAREARKQLESQNHSESQQSQL